MATDVDAEITRLSTRRQEIWAGADHAHGECERIAKQLADRFEERRLQRAQESTGRRRSEIVRQARVESELERLMTSR